MKKKKFQPAGCSQVFALWSSVCRFLTGWSCHHSWHKGWFCQTKYFVALLKSSAMVKSHRRTFCLVLLHLHSCLPWVPLFQPVCCAAQICETLNWWLFHIDGPRLQLKALQLLHSDPWPSSCFLSVTQMSSCTKMLIWYFRLLFL